MLVTIALLAFVHQTLAQDYPEVPLATGQPAGVTYQAELQASKPGSGHISGSSSADGVGVKLSIELTDLPDVETQGPFAYHIHVNQVPEDGNCTAAGPHLIPFGGPPDTVPCNATSPQYCQVGDMSGKHGKITAEKVTNNGYIVTYTDAYVSALEGNAAFFGNRSIVLHNGNGTRINCANFVKQQNASEPTHSANGTAPQTSYATSATESGSKPTNGAAPPAGTSGASEPYPSSMTTQSGSNSLDSSPPVLTALGLIGLVAAVWL